MNHIHYFYCHFDPSKIWLFLSKRSMPQIEVSLRPMLGLCAQWALLTLQNYPKHFQTPFVCIWPSYFARIFRIYAVENKIVKIIRYSFEKNYIFSIISSKDPIIWWELDQNFKPFSTVNKLKLSWSPVQTIFPTIFGLFRAELWYELVSFSSKFWLFLIYTASISCSWHNPVKSKPNMAEKVGLDRNFTQF